MRGEAEFCSENKNRFLLKREWSKSKKKVLYIMFNPSNADETKDDPTIRRLINFSKKFNYGGFFVGNLYTHISSNPNKIDRSQNISKKNLKKMFGIVKNHIGNGPIILKYCQNIDFKDIRSTIFSGCP